jgi:TolA-binding protein
MSASRLRPLLSAVLLLAAGCVLLATPVLAQGFGGTVEDILTRADQLLAQQRTNEAIVQYQDARGLCTTPAETVTALMGEGKAHLAMREFLPAAGLFEEAIQKYPDDPRQADLNYLAGYARNQGGDVAAAAVLLKKALESHPTPDLVPGIRFWLARATRMSGKPTETVDLLKSFETDFPAHPLIPKALYYLALAQHDAKDLAGAETTYRHLIEGYPHTQETLESFFDMADVLAALGKRDEASEFFRRYSNANPSSPIAARAMERAGDLSFFKSPKEAALYYGVAQIKLQANPPAPALPDLQVSGWLGSKATVANLLSQVWVLVALGALLVLILGGAAWFFVRRMRARSGGPGPEAAVKPSSA